MPDLTKKVCSRCRVEKPVEEFFCSKNTQDGRNRQCKDCCKSIHGDWVQRNKDRVKGIRHRYYLNKKPQSKISRSRRSHDIRAEAIQIYGGCCSCCGEGYLPFLMIVGTKEIQGAGSVYDRLRKHGYPPGPYVLCANCKNASDTGEQCHVPLERSA